MLFWTWSKGLEDGFDSKNRQNLKDFITSGPAPAPDYLKVSGATVASDSSEAGITGEAPEATPSEDATEAALYYVASRGPHDSARSSMELEKAGLPGGEVKREVARIPTCAIFHKLTPGRGVPHSFVGFVRQYPALPKVCVSGMSLYRKR